MPTQELAADAVCGVQLDTAVGPELFGVQVVVVKLLPDEAPAGVQLATAVAGVLFCVQVVVV